MMEQGESRAPLANVETAEPVALTAQRIDALVSLAEAGLASGVDEAFR